MRSYIISVFFCFCCITLNGQKKPHFASFNIYNGDTIFTDNIPQVDVLSFKNLDEKKKFLILKRRVLKVYPYAVKARDEILRINNVLDSINKKNIKRRYTKRVAKNIKRNYSDKLKNLTINEGKILVKLIYRETNFSSYQIVKTFRGRFNAYFWQTMAVLWDNNLKNKYDPINILEDRQIEHILTQAKIEGKL